MLSSKRATTFVAGFGPGLYTLITQDAAPVEVIVVGCTVWVTTKGADAYVPVGARGIGTGRASAIRCDRPGEGRHRVERPNGDVATPRPPPPPRGRPPLPPLGPRRGPAACGGRSGRIRVPVPAAPVTPAGRPPGVALWPGSCVPSRCRGSPALPSVHRFREVHVLASIPSATLLGVDGQPVWVEVHVSGGLPGYHVVGCPTRRDASRASGCAPRSSRPGVDFPLKRITVNFAPGNVRKTGAGLELAIALGIMLAESHLPEGCLDGAGVLGELGLDGSVRPVPGTLVLADALRRTGVESLVVPMHNAHEAGLLPDLKVRSARTLAELAECLKGELPWPEPDPPPPDPDEDAFGREPLDLVDVRGLATARVALEVAAAGSHHLIYAGPPGTGKTMLARRLPTILPPLDPDESFEVTRISSAAGGEPPRRLARHRPFRAPHHTASTAALVGGGSGRPRPGEVTLAHRGSCSSTSSGSSRHPRSTRSASRSKSASCASRVRRSASSCPRSSC